MRTLTSDQIADLLHDIGPTPMLWDFAEMVDRSVRLRAFTEANLTLLIRHWVGQQGRHQLMATNEELERFRSSEAAKELLLGMAVRQGLRLQFDPWDAGIDVAEFLNLLDETIAERSQRWGRTQQGGR